MRHLHESRRWGHCSLGNIRSSNLLVLGAWPQCQNRPCAARLLVRPCLSLREEASVLDTSHDRHIKPSEGRERGQRGKVGKGSVLGCRNRSIIRIVDSPVFDSRTLRLLSVARGLRGFPQVDLQSAKSADKKLYRFRLPGGLNGCLQSGGYRATQSRHPGCQWPEL